MPLRSGKGSATSAGGVTPKLSVRHCRSGRTDLGLVPRLELMRCPAESGHGHCPAPARVRPPLPSMPVMRWARRARCRGRRNAGRKNAPRADEARRVLRRCARRRVASSFPGGAACETPSGGPRARAHRAEARQVGTSLPFLPGGPRRRAAAVHNRASCVRAWASASKARARIEAPRNGECRVASRYRCGLLGPRPTPAPHARIRAPTASDDPPARAMPAPAASPLTAQALPGPPPV